MPWPLSQDYNEAIQSPARNFADPDLKLGTAETNALGLPMPRSGNFADVYEIRCLDGRRWAVKCFTREVVGLRQRYEAISGHLSRARLPFTVDFDYLDQGIRVAGRWYPALKMQWVEGMTLNQFVGRAADKPATLEGLLQIWVRMGKYLRTAEVSHCDLQHGNVLLVPGSGSASLALKLVDYDGMWVPALAGSASGEVGHPSYQHPRRAREGTYGPEVDRFPLLLVATALRALKAGGRPLWEKYDDGDNLLFTEGDLRTPAKSRLFLELIRSDDATTAAMANALVDALRGGVESAPPLEKLMPETLAELDRLSPRQVAVSPHVVVTSPPEDITSDGENVAQEPTPSHTLPAWMMAGTRRTLVKTRVAGVGALVAVLAILGVVAGVVYLSAQGSSHDPAASSRLLRNPPMSDLPREERKPSANPVPAAPPRFLVISIEKAATADSSKPLYGTPSEELIFPKWGNIEFKSIQFAVLEPTGGKKNAIVLRAGWSGWYPKEASVPCGVSARVIHLLSGVSGGGWHP